MNDNEATFAGLAATAFGARDGRPPLVLLHGLTFDRSMWRPALRELERLDPGRYAVAFDLPGHGESLELTSYRLSNVVARLHAAIEAAELEPPIVVGHSVSAVIATVYAGLHPTTGVVNVGPTLHITPFASFLKAHAAELEGPEFDSSWRRLWESMRPDLLPAAAERLLVETCRPRQDVAVGYSRDLLDHSLIDLDFWLTGRLGALRAVGVRYCVIAGDQVDSLYRGWLASQLPHAAVTVLPRSGHFPHLAHPRSFAERLSAFADGIAVT